MSDSGDQSFYGGLDYAMTGGCGDDYGAFGGDDINDAYGGTDFFDMKRGGGDGSSPLMVALLIVVALVLVYYAWCYECRRRAKQAHKLAPAKPYNPMRKLNPVQPYTPPPNPSAGFRSHYGNRFVGGSGVSGRGLGAGQVGAGLVGVGMTSAGMSSGLGGSGCGTWASSATSEASAIDTINGGDSYSSF